MSTIERRMDLLLRSQAFLTVYGAAHEYAEARIHLEARDTTEAAIVKEWNAAVKVMKAIADKSVYQLGDDIICEGCRKYAGASAEVEHVSDCPVGALLKLIAQMEGN